MLLVAKRQLFLISSSQFQWNCSLCLNFIFEFYYEFSGSVTFLNSCDVGDIGIFTEKGKHPTPPYFNSNHFLDI